MVLLMMLCGIRVEAGPVTYSQAVLADDPVAYWRFNETDASGGLVDHADDPVIQAGAQNGSFTGSPTFGEPGALICEDDPAIRWNPNDGDDDFASLTGFPMTDSFTVELWAKSVTEKWNVFGWFASSRKSNGFIVHPNEERYGNTGTSWSGYVHDSGGSHHNIAKHEFSSAGLLVTDWHYYAITYDAGADTGRMYLDGQQVGSNDSMGVSRQGNASIDLFLGRDDLNDRFGNGWLDEVAIYPDSLTPDQIQTHYNASLPEPTTSVLLAAALILIGGSSRRSRAW